MKRRVVVTGIGVVSSIGIGVDVFWDNLVKGNSKISKIKQFDPDVLPCKFGAEVKDFDPHKYFTEKEIRMNPRYAQFAMVAADEAISQSKIFEGENKPEKGRVGVMIGTSAAGLTYSLDQLDRYRSTGRKGMDTFITSIMNNGVATHSIAKKYQIFGPCNTVTSTCVASTDAIGNAFRMIQYNDVDAMICGGAEAVFSEATCLGFYIGKILTKKMKDSPKPFDKNRSGTVLGEGSGILVLEEYEQAKKRGANIICELAGYGATMDAFHVVIPDPRGIIAAEAVQKAIDDAGVLKKDIGYINAHGTGTVKNDIAETTIIKNVFGKRAYKIPMSATKSTTGHALGSAGAIESIATIKALKEQLAPPTMNLESPDPKCDLDYVPNKARKCKINVAIKNSFGFGGYNSSIVYKKV